MNNIQTKSAKDYIAYTKSTAKIPGSKPVKRIESKYLAEMKRDLKYENIKFVAEYKFHPLRRWRSDIFIPSLNLLIEYEGVNTSEKSGHTKLKAYSNNCEKYNECTKLGFKLLRYTCLNYRNLLTDLKQIK